MESVKCHYDNHENNNTDTILRIHFFDWLCHHIKDKIKEYYIDDFFIVIGIKI